jgi:hypothetical protein
MRMRLTPSPRHWIISASSRRSQGSLRRRQKTKRIVSKCAFVRSVYLRCANQSKSIVLNSRIPVTVITVFLCKGKVPRS